MDMTLDRIFERVNVLSAELHRATLALRNGGAGAVPGSGGVTSGALGRQDGQGAG